MSYTNACFNSSLTDILDAVRAVARSSSGTALRKPDEALLKWAETFTKAKKP